MGGGSALGQRVGVQGVDDSGWGHAGSEVGLGMRDLGCRRSEGSS